MRGQRPGEVAAGVLAAPIGVKQYRLDRRGRAGIEKSVLRQKIVGHLLGQAVARNLPVIPDAAGGRMIRLHPAI
ncbi:MAG: hypothetical protein LBI62_07420 [Candidatus Accumulibacter sp.]|jgi:hypothetical protein|nr:hypothetical protein [Accumulibacter sp.]